jgi:putative N-acetyltransferase (TIGR04045 family)
LTTTGVEASPSSTSADVVCRVVANPAETEVHHAIRRQVFVVEQHLFDGGDWDERDEDPATLHVLGMVGDVPGGTVRLYPLDDQGLWKGDRLAVLPEFRRHGLGAPLVRYAVKTASERGGQRMIAYIQLPNVRFFAALGWHAIGEPALYVGVVHQQMAIALAPESGAS